MARSSRKRVTHGTLLVLLVTLFTTLQPASATQVVLGYRASAGVSITSFGGSLYMAFIGTDSNQTINIGQSSDGLNWSAQWQVSDGHGGFQRSFDTPGIAAFNGKLWLVWTGTVGSGSNINIASSTDGHNFTVSSVSQDTSAHGVSLYPSNGKLYLAFVPAWASQSTVVISTTDGVNWGPGTFYGFPNTESPFTPTLFTYGTSTWLTYSTPATASDAFRRNHTTLVTAGSGGGIPSAPNPSNGVNSGVGAAWDGGSLFYYAYQGPGNASALELATYQLQAGGGFALLSSALTGQTAFGNPTVIGNWNGQAFLLWVGTNADHNVNVMTLK